MVNGWKIGERMIPGHVGASESVIASVDGSRVTTTDGRTFIHALAGARGAVFGLAPAELLSATARPTDAEELKACLRQASPGGQAQVFLASSGEDAYRSAVRACLERGGGGAVLHLCGTDHGEGVRSGVVAGEGVILPTAAAYRCPVAKGNLEKCGEHCLEDLDRWLARGGRAAAVVIEPVLQRDLGVVLHPPSFLSSLAERCRKHGIPLICDERVTGMGSTGRELFASSHEDVTPDILVLGEGLSGGVESMGALLVSGSLSADFSTSNPQPHPGASSRALAHLRLIKESNILERSRKEIHDLGNELVVLYTSPLVGEIRTRGMFVGVELVKNSDTGEAFDTAFRAGPRVVDELVRRGIIAGCIGDVVVIQPVLASTVPELARLVAELHASLEVLQKV